jgi:hypothetical protein
MQHLKKVNIYLFFLLGVFKCTAAFSQDTLIVKYPWKMQVTNREGVKLNYSKLKEAASAEELPGVVSNLRKAQTLTIIGDVFGYPGAFIFGYGLGLSLSSNSSAGELIIIGGALMGVQVSINMGLRNRYLMRAIEEYNLHVYKRRLENKNE